MKYGITRFFTQLGDIYDFHFEKNRNGSYRVNTVIKELIYDDLYTSADFNESQIGYFLANDDLSYQNYPNIRNSFSELMNPKDNSNRFPVLEFADSIDIGKMYLYYNTLTNNLEQENRMLCATLLIRFLRMTLSFMPDSALYVPRTTSTLYG